MGPTFFWLGKEEALHANMRSKKWGRFFLTRQSSRVACIAALSLGIFEYRARPCTAAGPRSQSQARRRTGWWPAGRSDTTPARRCTRRATIRPPPDVIFFLPHDPQNFHDDALFTVNKSKSSTRYFIPHFLISEWKRNLSRRTVRLGRRPAGLTES
jgi:hypothetical protein